MRLPVLLLLAGLSWVAHAQPAAPFRFEEDFENKGWKEIETQLPAYPKPENLIAFKVTPSDFQFYVDSASLSVDSDGVVRYTLVAKGAGGGVNVAYEGIRCKTWEFRAYAYGRSDNTWSKSGKNDWTGIQRAGRTLAESVLASDFFCPERIIIISTAKEGIDALKRGKHLESLR